jgi:putative tricarboxylic transport membrane protein
MPFRALPITSFSFLVLGIAYLADNSKLPMGSAAKPGAGLFPLLVGVSLLGLSLAILIWALRNKNTAAKDQEPFPEGKDRQRVLALGGILALFVLLLKPLGYGICSAALMAAVLRFLGLRSWGRILLISLATAAISFYLFDALLGVPLPRGIFFS